MIDWTSILVRQVEKPFQAKYMREDILSRYRGRDFSWYPFVRKIGDTRPRLEMDLIVVENDTETVVGYEFKYLNYEEPWKNYHSLYKGLGQIFSYFTYGIEQGWLIVGISKTVRDSVSEKLKELTATIETHLKARDSSYLGLHLKHDVKGTYRYLPIGINYSLNTCTHLPIENPVVQKDHDNIVKGKLTKREKWLNDNQLPVLW